MKFILLIAVILVFGCASGSQLISSGVQPNEGYSYTTPEGGGGWHAGPERLDPLEKDPKYKVLFLQVDVETEKTLKDQGLKPQLGYCHVFWQTKKEILRKKYKIDWKTPAELNPFICYD